MITTLSYIRENNIPCLGICLGLQLMVIEYARNMMGIPLANSLEFDKNCAPNDVITLLDSQKNIVNLGGTMRLGKQTSVLQPGSISDLYDVAGRLSGNNTISERFRHRYEVHPDIAQKLETTDFHIVGYNNSKEKIVQFVELDDTHHPYYVATQSHPELTSTLESPAPLFVGLVQACMK